MFRRYLEIATAGLLLAGVGAGAARGADLQPPIPAPATTPLAPASLGFFIKVGVTFAVNTSSSKLYSEQLPGGPLPEIPGVGANFSNVATLGLEAGYFITPNLSLDVSGGIPLWVNDTTKGASPTGIPPDSTRLGAFMPAIVPVTAVYRFTQLGPFQPYLGAGFAPIFSFAQRDAFITGSTVDSTVGLVLQGGADIMIDNHWGWSFDVKKVFANSQSHGTGENFSTIGVPLGELPLTSAQKVNFQPWLLSTGVTYRF